MALIIEAPNEVFTLKNHNNIGLFLAGGITNCPEWQEELIMKLIDIDPLTIYNPRRKNFPIHDPNASEEQVTWEYNHLRDCDIVSFWFSRGSNPIVLYEYGKWALGDEERTFVVGIDPEYERKQDVIIQTQLELGRDDEDWYAKSLDELRDHIVYYAMEHLRETEAED